MARRKSRGCQKIEMVKIKNEGDLQATFSKRRGGLFKYADGLSILTGANLAVIVFSPGNKPFSFGCPDVQSIIRLYERQKPQNLTEADKALQLQRLGKVQKLNGDLTIARQHYEVEKNHGESLDRMILAESREPIWWEGNITQMSLDQLERFKVSMKDLKRRVLRDYQCYLKQEIQNDPFIPQQNPYEINSEAASSAARVSPNRFVPFDDSRAAGTFPGHLDSGGGDDFQSAPAGSLSK